MAQISGVARRYDGLPVDYVLVFNWVTGDCLGTYVPDNNGNWSHNYYFDLRCGITYVSDGCEPITHGAYFFEAQVEFKWWRIINITVRKADVHVRSAAELRFINNGGYVSNEPSRGFSESFFNQNYLAGNAFDGISTTLTHSKGGVVNEADGLGWYLGYEFANPVIVESIAVKMRHDMGATEGQEWQTADIEVSDDGINWVKYGYIEPNITAMDLSMVTTPIIKI